MNLEKSIAGQLEKQIGIPANKYGDRFYQTWELIGHIDADTSNTLVLGDTTGESLHCLKLYKHKNKNSTQV